MVVHYGSTWRLLDLLQAHFHFWPKVYNIHIQQTMGLDMNIDATYKLSYNICRYSIHTTRERTRVVNILWIQFPRQIFLVLYFVWQKITRIAQIILHHADCTRSYWKHPRSDVTFFKLFTIYDAQHRMDICIETTPKHLVPMDGF